MPKATVMIVDNDDDFIAIRADFLEVEGYLVMQVYRANEAKQRLQAGGIDVIIVDIRLENDNDENDYSGLLLAKELGTEVPKVVLTGFASYNSVREALKTDPKHGKNILDFVAKSEGPLAMLRVVENVLRSASGSKCTA